MNTLGNLLWIIFGGLVICLFYCVYGFLFCLTIIGIPFGLQLFKLGGFALCPFGREAVSKPNADGCLSIVMNLVWILLGWWELAIFHLFMCVACFITIIGIPFAKQHLKLMVFSIMPFGQEIKSC